MKFQLLFTAISITLFVSCSPEYSYFTQSLYEKEKWTEKDIQHIQFYISKDIILSRAIDAGETSITEGKIRIKNGQQIEQVVIKAYTPGVLVLMPKEDRFAISFEETDNEAYLMFGPNPKYYDRFALLAQDWGQDQGTIHYRGKEYFVDAESAYASLMVDLRKEGEDQLEKHQAEGRTIKTKS